jgi:hypothetical protein
MTNVTLSIENSVYQKMKEYSEIKWSEMIRKMIKQRIKELEQINRDKNNETILTMFASENILKKDWDNKADERWNNV